MQIELGSVDGLSTKLPDAQMDVSTGVVGGVGTRLATMMLTGAPFATGTPVDELDPVTVPRPV
jgi:hypothetical protein